MTLTEKELIRKARMMFQRMKKRRAVKEAVAGLQDISIRFDLIGHAPEVRFVLAIEDGELRFITDRVYADLAVGIQREYFLELIERPPGRCGKRLLSNIFLRNGAVGDFKRLKPVFMAFLGGRNSRE